MLATRILLRLTSAAWLVFAGCGQTGALYLPDEGVETPVEVRTTTTPQPTPEAAPAPTPAPAPAPEPEDEDKDSDRSRGF